MRCDLLSCMHVSSTNVSPYWMVTWALVWTLFALSAHFASLFVKAPSAHFPSGEAVPAPVNAFPVAMSCQCILRHKVWKRSCLDAVCWSAHFASQCLCVSAHFASQCLGTLYLSAHFASQSLETLCLSGHLAAQCLETLRLSAHFGNAMPVSTVWKRCARQRITRHSLWKRCVCQRVLRHSVW